jgi:hypothetical protein
MPQPLHFDVHIHPFAATAGVQQVLYRAVGGDCGRGSEHHLPHVHADFRVLIHVLDEFWRGGAPAPGTPPPGPSP